MTQYDLNPVVIHSNSDTISRRDFFAAYVINGLLSSISYDGRSNNIKQLVVESVRIADEMIVELQID